ncbi:MAG: peptide-N-glycosidase F-related protein [Bacteroidota bacterium]|nr:peptide-N-glycosidase F-related protein [Bacteroidota bacterium]
MVKLKILLVLLITCLSSILYAQSPRDTLQTFTYGSPSQAKFLFPPLSEKFEKIVMHYKLRCPPGVQCGEWDYLMYVNLYDHTGKMDSVIDTVYSYRVNGLTPPTVSFDWNPTYSFFPRFSYAVSRKSSALLDSGTVGIGADTSLLPFKTPFTGARAQYVWRKSELLAAGLKKGDITGIRWNAASGGPMFNDLTLRMKLSTKDTLAPTAFETGGFTTVYEKDTKFNSPGWNRLDFPFGFSWDGVSNIIVDISTDNGVQQTAGVYLFDDATSYSSGVTSNADEVSMHFENNDFIDVPPAALNGCDSAITIAFWQYGNPKYQPQNQSSFEAINSLGQRVLNAHVPWSDGTVYWDAGDQFGAYDRIQKAADSNDYKGKWTHWAFVKNVKSGAMTIYQNGVQWLTGTGKKKPMGDITRFHLGAGSNGDNNFDGNITEFAIWNTDLPAASIKSFMNNQDDGAFATNRRVYYPFIHNTASTTKDESSNGFDGRSYGIPMVQRTVGKDYCRNFIQLKIRPETFFEEGNDSASNATVTSTTTLDSVENDVMQIVRNSVSPNGPIPIDTLYVWPKEVRYRFSNSGAILDSTVLAADTMMSLVKTPYYRKFEIINRYEIARYITEYGNPTSPANTLASGGEFTWDYDVSDYRTLLHDSVELNAYNQQELVDVSFEFVKGTPPRDPLSVTNLWNGDFWYGTNTPIETWLHPLRVKVPSSAINTRIKIRPTGHGGGDQENCSEFCPKDHWILVDSTERWRQNVWREDCGLNPLYPQGGTWIYSRTNWCPGSDVHTYNFELTPFVTPGDSMTVDYKIDPYTTNGGGNTPNWVIETQLISYGKPNFTQNAAITEIKSPSSTNAYARHNPICGNPVITIQNRGTKPLTSLDIAYGIIGTSPSSYHWSGSLNFLDTIDVELGKFSWASDSKRFRVSISNPNGGSDEYPGDDVMESDFTAPPVYPSKLVFEYKTNAAPEEDSYVLLDENGKTVLQRDNTLDPNTFYRDTISLPDGCYRFIMTDLGIEGAGDGLAWWANPGQGSGSMRIRKPTGNTILKSFPTDFGRELYLQFAVGSSSAVAVTGNGETKLDIYPNPAPKKFTLGLEQPYRQDVLITVYNMLGDEVYRAFRKQIVTDNITIDLPDVSEGTYIVRVASESGVMSKKVIVKN